MFKRRLKNSGLIWTKNPLSLKKFGALTIPGTDLMSEQLPSARTTLQSFQLVTSQSRSGTEPLWLVTFTVKDD